MKNTLLKRLNTALILAGALAFSDRAESSTNSVSSDGINLLKRMEGFRAKPYSDAGGYSIGYGHFILPGENLKEVTREQAEQILRKDIATAEKAVKSYVNVPLTRNQYDSLVSFTYNTGAGSLQKSTLRKKLNTGDYMGAANSFTNWVYSQGKVSKSLVNRRQQEKELFLKQN